MAKKKKIMLKFNSYLAGLFEGDGHISINEKYNPRFCITTHEKNEPWLLHIKKKLKNFGFIRKKKKERALVLTISNKQGILLLINTLNGNLKTPKIEKFKEMLEWYNKKENTNIPLLPINYDLDNAWLSGFIEADGSFLIRYSIPKKASKKLPRIAAKFSLDQRMTLSKDENNQDETKSYKEILTSIANYLNCNLLTVTKKTGKTYYNITISNNQGTNNLIKYFTKYPLSSSKHLDFLNWKEVVQMINKKEHLIQENFKKILELKKEMNKSRTIYEWNNLT